MISDHAWVTCEFQLDDQMTGTRFWTLNKSVLHAELTQPVIATAIQNYLLENDNEEVKEDIVWDALKITIRDQLISSASFLKNLWRARIQDVLSNIALLEQEHKRKTTYQNLLKERECLWSLETLDIEEKCYILISYLGSILQGHKNARMESEKEKDRQEDYSNQGRRRQIDL